MDNDKPMTLPQETLWKIQATVEKKSAARHKKEVDQLREELDLTQRQIEAILEVKSGIGQAVPEIKAGKHEKSSSTAIALASDWHVEETVQAAAVNGLNEFNPDVAEQRIQTFFRKIVYLTNTQRKSTDIETLVLPLLGDFITGYIHEELQETNSMTPAEATVWVMPRIVAGFDFLKKEGGFKRIIVPCCVGNHGRTTKKMHYKTRTQNSYEYILYHVLQMHVEDIEFHIAQGYHQLIQLYEFTMRCHHGDQIRYKDGVGGITIPVNKKIAKWDMARQADFDCFGHHHTSFFSKKWICNGSLIGPTELGADGGYEVEPPQQAFFLVRAGRGRTIHAPIFLE